MSPAIRPLVSCEDPSVAEMTSELCSVKLSGRAPNLSWSASALALSCVKLPVMEGLPLVTTPCVTGAEMTSLSSTNANWLRGDSSVIRRVDMSPNCFVPSPSKTRLTDHVPVLTPWLDCWRPLVASEIVLPSTSTGPRTYFAAPSSEQAMIARSAGAACPSFSGAVAQSYAANSAWRRGVTHETSLGPVGSAVGSSERVEGSGVASAAGVSAAGVEPSAGADPSVGVGVGVAATEAVPAAPMSTGRSSSFADDCRRCMVAASGSPGRLTTMLLPPCVVISASETPLASTRWRMMETACASCSLVGPEEAPSSCGARMICVPPSRSSASLGLHEPLLNATLAALPPARRPMMTSSQMSLRLALRTGVGDLATWTLDFLRGGPAGSARRSGWRGERVRARRRPEGGRPVAARPGDQERAVGASPSSRRRVASVVPVSSTASAAGASSTRTEASSATVGSTTRAMVWRCSFSTVPGETSR